MAQAPPRPAASDASFMSIDTEDPEDWKELATSAKERIASYKPTRRHHKDELPIQRALNAFVDHLPQDGRESVARDILKANTDDQLYEVFMNLYTGLAVPSESFGT